jgi:hypothetical protein
MPVSCLICRSNNHILYECTSSHLPHMSVFIVRYMNEYFDEIYSKPYENSIHWLATLDVFSGISIGELIYLNRDIVIGGNILTNNKEIQIYLFIYHRLTQYYETARYSPDIMEGISIDLEYWYSLLCMSGSESYRNNIRISKWESIRVSYIFILGYPHCETIECPICISDKECVYSHRFNCGHSVCVPCSNRLLDQESRSCPLCRRPIRIVTYYT